MAKDHAAQQADETKKAKNAAAVLAVEIEPTDYEAPDEALYWVGLTQDCPVGEVIVGAVTFRRYSRRTVPSLSGQSLVEYPGGMARLSQAQVDATLESLKTVGIEVQRNEDGDVARAHVTRLRHGHEPAASYCWMQQVAAIPDPGTALPDVLFKKK